MRLDASDIRRLAMRLGHTVGEDTGPRGFVLVVVLWGVLALALIAMAIGQMARGQSDTVRTALSQLEDTALAEAGLNRALFALITEDGTLSRKLVADGRAFTWGFAGRTLSLRLESEGGKIDLNAGDPTLLKRLLEQLGETVEATALLRRIEARRARGQRFHSLNVLVSVTGPGRGRPDLGSLFTVHAERPTIDPMTAPAGVLSALPGAQPGLVEEIMASRRAGNLTRRVRALSRYLGRGLSVFRVVSQVQGDDGPGRGVEAILDLRPEEDGPHVLAWQRMH